MVRIELRKSVRLKVNEPVGGEDDILDILVQTFTSGDIGRVVSRVCM